MPHYFFHLVDGDAVVFDPDGLHMPAEAVAASARLQARDCIAGDVRHGRLDLTLRIDVHDEAGELVRSLEFADALQAVPPR